MEEIFFIISFFPRLTNLVIYYVDVPELVPVPVLVSVPVPVPVPVLVSVPVPVPVPVSESR